MAIRVGSSAAADHIIATWHAVHRGYLGTQLFFQRSNPPVITNFVANPRSIDLDQRPTGNVDFTINCDNTNRAQLLSPTGSVLWSRTQAIRNIPISAAYSIVFPGSPLADPAIHASVRYSPPNQPLFNGGIVPREGGRNGRDDTERPVFGGLSYFPRSRTYRGVSGFRGFITSMGLPPWALYLDDVSYIWGYVSWNDTLRFTLASGFWAYTTNHEYALFAPVNLLSAGRYRASARILLFDGRFVDLNTGIPEKGGGMQRGYNIHDGSSGGWPDGFTAYPSLSGLTRTLAAEAPSDETRVPYVIVGRGVRTDRNGVKRDADKPVGGSALSGRMRALYYVVQSNTHENLISQKGFFVVEMNDKVNVPTHIGLFGKRVNSVISDPTRLPLTRMTQSGYSNFYRTPVTRVISNLNGSIRTAVPDRRFLVNFWIGVMKGWEWFDMDDGAFTPFSARFHFTANVPQPYTTSRYVLQAFNDDGAAHRYVTLPVTKNPVINAISVTYQTGLGIPGATVRFRGRVAGQPRPTVTGDQSIGTISARHFTATTGGDWLLDFTHHFGVSGSRNVLLTATNSSGTYTRRVPILVP